VPFTRRVPHSDYIPAERRAMATIVLVMMTT